LPKGFYVPGRKREFRVNDQSDDRDRKEDLKNSDQELQSALFF
jgi:hypothetical protein